MSRVNELNEIKSRKKYKIEKKHSSFAQDTLKYLTELTEEELNNLPLEEKQQFLKENEANIRECIGEAVPTIIMQKIAKNIKEVLITGKKSQKKGQTRLI